MTACPDWLLMLHGLLDDELDAANSIAAEGHLKICGGCAEEFAGLEALRTTMPAGIMRYPAPPSLRARIEQDFAAASRPAAGARTSSRGHEASGFPDRKRRVIGISGRSTALGALTGIAATLLLVVAMPQWTTLGTQDQLVASHVRSLLANHVTDVTTSNRHVVKPWFNGRIDFAPPVFELAGQGFPLAGGRLDYVDGRVVAAIVYHRRLHTINLFVRPVAALVMPLGLTTRRDGYSLVRWTQGSLEFWAVSDVDPAELELFHRTFAAQVVSTEPIR